MTILCCMGLSRRVCLTLHSEHSCSQRSRSATWGALASCSAPVRSTKSGPRVQETKRF